MTLAALRGIDEQSRRTWHYGREPARATCTKRSPQTEMRDHEGWLNAEQSPGTLKWREGGKLSNSSRAAECRRFHPVWQCLPNAQAPDCRSNSS